MKPITVILPGGGTWSMSADEGRTLAEQILRACDAVAPETIDPTPMPAPALGMRVWFQMQRETGESMESRDITFMGTADTWETLSVPAALLPRVVLITDFRTGEVIWRKQ